VTPVRSERWGSGRMGDIVILNAGICEMVSVLVAKTACAKAGNEWKRQVIG
jgi:hypothetical protein